MARHIEEHQDQYLYRTFDDRVVSRKVIEHVLRDLEVRDHRREMVSRLRTWALLAAVIISVLAVTVFLWWHLLPHI